jgi:radical SAM-linked protein
MDIEVENRIPKNFVKIMNSRLPVGFYIVNSRWDSKKLPSLNSSITLASYRIVLEEKFRIMEIKNWIDEFLEKNSFKVIRKKQGKEKEVDIRLYVVECSLNNEGVDLFLRLTQKGTARVEEVLQAILSPYDNNFKVKNVERTGLYIEKQNKRLTPMQIE